MTLTIASLFDLSKFAHRHLWDGLENPWEILDVLSEYLLGLKLGKIDVDIPKGVYLVNPEQISIGKNSIIEPGSFIQGPCVLGESTQVRHGAYIRGNVITGNHCVIGHATEIKGSIMLDAAKAPHKAYVGDSVIGNSANLGAGSVLANLRLDGKQVRINSQNSGRRKLGALIGDGAQLGCNCVTNPGTIVLKESYIKPCTAVGGVISNG